MEHIDEKTKIVTKWINRITQTESLNTMFVFASSL